MRTTLGLLSFLLLAGGSFAATDIRVDFTLKTTDANGAPLQQHRYYYVYRPDGLDKSVPVPMLLVFEASPASGPAGFLHDRANKAGFIVVSCSFSGNSTGTPGTVWTDDNPQFAGFEDYDYIAEVIDQVRASQNANDVFLTGLSKGGHMSLAYACVRPSTITAASSVDEFMGLTSNIPTAPLPMIMFHGTLDTNVPYTMMKDTVDAWRTVDSLLNATPITTSEPSPLMPGKVTQATWRDDSSGLQVALVTIVGGNHTYPTPGVETGYDFTAGLWAFFSQFLTSTQGSPRIVAQPVNNIQLSGQPASFRVAASGGSVSYHWQRNGADIPGATANWYTLPMTTPGDDGATFQAVVGNDSGSVISAAATLTVKAPPAGPAITAQPQDQAVAAAQPASFTVSSTGAPPLSYQWTKNGVNIAGATAATLAMPAVISSDCGAAFRVVVTSAAGSVTSAPATLTVIRPGGAPFMLVNPDRARVLAGQQANFSVTAWSPSPMTYQWQKGRLTSNMADIPGATDSTYTTQVTTLADHLTLFRCVVSNQAGSVTSASEFLFVTGAPAPPTQITSLLTAAVQVGTGLTYTITSSGGTTPIAYSANPLPAGLSLDSNSGLLSGIPAATGDTSIAIGAANSAGSISATLTLSVMATAPVISIDSWRLAHFGASAIDPSIAGDTADPDGDGFTNLEEFTFGSDPLDSASVPAALSASPSANDFGAVPAGSSVQATFTIANITGSGR